MRHWSGALMALLALLLASPADGNAQNRGGSSPEVTLEAYGGFANFGRFLEQRFDDGERELTGNTAAAVGGSVGIWPWEKTGMRLAFTWSPTELEFADDSGTDSNLRDADELADLNAYVFSFEVLRFLLDENSRLAPYATAGVSATIWSLDRDGDAAGAILTNGGDDTQTRFGGVGGIGVQFRAAPKFSLRLEANTFALGNPFDGNDAFQVTSGETFDEPDSVSMRRLALALIYSFGG